MLTFMLIACGVLLWTESVAGVEARRRYDHGIGGVDTERPLIIGHRGSSGVLPEHTRQAYERAIADGADVIECDIVVSSDGQLICRHDPWLSSSTDIEQHNEFADRKRTIVNFEYYGSLRNITDWFVVDFTLDELKTLRVNQVNGARDQGYNGKFSMITFREHAEIAQDADRTIVIYPELKYPRWVNSLDLFNGSSFEQRFLDELRKLGYDDHADPCVLQAFEFDSVKTLASMTDLPVVMAIEYDFQATADLLQQYAAAGCYGVATWKCSFVDHYGPDGGYKNWIRNVSTLVDDVHDHGMKLHVYTFRNENSDLAWDFDQDPMREYDLYMDLGVDGYFTDFPATLARYLDVEYRETTATCRVNSAPQIVASLLVMCTSLIVTAMTYAINISC